MDDRVTLFGDVVAVDGDGIRVRLDSDEIAVLSVDDDRSFEVGDRGEFVVIGRDADGRLQVSPLGRPGADEDAAFDREFDRLQSALSGRGAATRPRSPSPTPKSLHEEEVRAWVRHVDGGLAQLRKHRAKRLNEQVASES